MDAPKFDTLLYDLDDGVATITMNRPERLNATNMRMRRELIAAFDHTDADDDVKAVILTGAGRAFCSGGELDSPDAFSGTRPPDPDAAPIVAGIRRDGGGTITLRMFDSLKPIICAINGPCAGFGVAITLAADIRLASTAAHFNLVYGRRGINPEGAASWFLSRAVGLQTAFEWCFSGRRVFPQEALERGLLRSVHEPAELLPAAAALAREFADNSAPVSVALIRQMLWRMAGAAHPMEGHMVESRGIRARGGSADALEGVGAFLEKRQPHFTNSVSRELPDLWDWWTPPEFR